MFKDTFFFSITHFHHVCPGIGAVDPWRFDHEVPRWAMWKTSTCSTFTDRGGRNRIGRREKWPKKSWEEGEIGGKSREEGEKET